MSSHTQHLSSEMRRAATVKAVVWLAARHNPSEITTTAIAHHMGVTQGALFKHFATKEAVLESVMQWVTDSLLKRVDQAAATATSPLKALEAIFMTHVEFVVQHPGVPRILFAELQRAETSGPKRKAQELVRRYGERLRCLVDQGKRRGELRAELDTAAAVTLFIGTVQGLVMQSMLAGSIRIMRQQAPGVLALYRRSIESAR
jgi:TetR/AcrR family transcriptional regulator